VFRNPLAEPFTLGVSSGASLAAAIGYVCGVHGSISLVGLPAITFEIPVMTLLAFVGAGVASLAVLALTRLRTRRDLATPLLAGVCISYLCGAGILVAMWMSDQTITNQIFRWTMGSLAFVRQSAPLETGLIFAIAFVGLLRLAKPLDVIALGADVAATRGVSVDRTVWLSVGLVALSTAAVVAFCGPIGFVGLMTPHLARGIVPGGAAHAIASSALVGAAFLCVCDALARPLPVELPVGVLTNFIGALFFFALLIRTRRELAL
jgi:iron complex transport system permease protein